MVIISFRRHAFNDSWENFEMLQMAQPHIIFWWYVIGRSWVGAQERIIVSLIIISFVSAFLDPSKPPLSGEVTSSLCNFCMEHYSNSFGTLHFTPDSASVISKVSRAVGDSRTFEFFIIQSTNFSINSLLTCFVQTMHGLIDHFTAALWTWAIKCPHFVEAFFPNDIHLTFYIEVNA